MFRGLRVETHIYIEANQMIASTGKPHSISLPGLVGHPPQVMGPCRSRCASQRLLAGYIIAFGGMFEDAGILLGLKQLASYAGGRVVEINKLLTADVLPATSIILVDSARVEDDVLDSVSHLPPETVRDFYWLMDSVTSYCIQPAANYVLDEPDTAPLDS
eukprot:m.103599 g.103599  ORF g.103599 m.103599 type:complete len:160 (+) comp15050_c5_seq2:397-876(+)